MSSNIQYQHRQLRLKLKRAKATAQMAELQSQLLLLASYKKSPDASDASSSGISPHAAAITGLQNHPELQRQTLLLLSGINSLLANLNSLSLHSLAISDQLTVNSKVLSAEERLALKNQKTRLNEIIAGATAEIEKIMSLLLEKLGNLPGHA